MTDRESELIARLMDGDMEAYDELMPNARPEDRKDFEEAIKKAKEIGGEQDPISRAWLLFILHIIGKYMGDFREYDRKANQELADAWDRCIANIVNKQDKDNMNLKELLEERERLCKINAQLRGYDELKDWKRYFESGWSTLARPIGEVIEDITPNITHSKIPDHIREIIVNALQSEIDKLEKEKYLCGPMK